MVEGGSKDYFVDVLTSLGVACSPEEDHQHAGDDDGERADHHCHRQWGRGAALLGVLHVPWEPQKKSSVINLTTLSSD